MFNLLYLLPRNILSNLIGRLAAQKSPAFLARLAIKYFVKLTGIDLSEASKPLTAYDSVAEVFTRSLKPGARKISGEPVTPVDGIHRQSETINDGTLIQAKGKSYSLTDLLSSKDQALKFQKGYYSNFYLSPRHYHRIHSPVSGLITSYSYIPGTLWPVNDWSISAIDQLFCINERVVVYIESNLGTIAVVLVGATNVGKISLSFTELISNQYFINKPGVTHTTLSEKIPIETGMELGIFHLGSTVILLFENSPKISLASGQEVSYGQSLG